MKKDYMERGRIQRKDIRSDDIPWWIGSPKETAESGKKRARRTQAAGEDK